MKTYISAAFAASALVAAPMAAADGLYFNGGYTFLSLDDDDVDADVEGLTGRVGYDFNPIFGAELEGTFGTSSEDDVIEGVNVSVEANYLVGAFGKAELNIPGPLRVFGRAGIVNGELEVEASTGMLSASESESETGVAFGAGATYAIVPHIFVRGDYTLYSFDDFDADGFTVALGFRF